MSIYDDLEKLKRLLDEGVVSPEEYEREKARILSAGYAMQPQDGTWDLGIDEYSFAALMHASQFVTAFIIPLICWLMLRDKSRIIDDAGKNILNFEISLTIYTFALCVTCIGAVLVPILALVAAVLIVIGIIKALNRESWDYPLTIKLLK